MPDEAASALTVGFLRKDVALGLMGTMELSAHQLVIGSTILAIFFPCIASFVVLTRELRVKGMILSTGIMLVTAITVGGVLRLILI